MARGAVLLTLIGWLLHLGQMSGLGLATTVLHVPVGPLSPSLLRRYLTAMERVAMHPIALRLSRHRDCAGRTW